MLDEKNITVYIYLQTQRPHIFGHNSFALAENLHSLLYIGQKMLSLPLHGTYSKKKNKIFFTRHANEVSTKMAVILKSIKIKNLQIIVFQRFFQAICVRFPLFLQLGIYRMTNRSRNIVNMQMHERSE